MVAAFLEKLILTFIFKLFHLLFAAKQQVKLVFKRLNINMHLTTFTCFKSYCFGSKHEICRLSKYIQVRASGVMNQR